ncbi:Predicted ATP-dependent endonuclease of the OLD family, contains P-loop ATPase and TOPRIM domains [Paenimyroides aquimaris]|uniref:Predicted ATP-dependent endonuclease of the OLD family, contains P-loop ATPase and TOPRIM domains n=1 Tax=Paenimyroides marinum TaxID=1159016 RepID=A0A1H6J2C2_9FLAO|nr:ATP-binding protein [Paenimyroides aquimaris]SEH54349.1 Predicted ATP-dependent endonuclease of the OLD family, contains P-loop ATPase and TOPRIM domains [Paenimyroides aquimaris]
MYISKLSVKNFKCYNEIEINFDPNFNLIIGENNSGKSTILDALRLWQLAFQKFLKDRTNNQSSSFYASQFFSFTIDDISFLRILDFQNLFKNKSKKDFEITLTISDGTNEIILPIIFLKTTKGQVLNFQLCKEPNQRPDISKKISDLLGIPLGSDFKEIFLFTYINPIFLLPNKEPQYSKGYILNKLRESKANEIIRNLLYAISPERKKIKKEVKEDKLLEIEDTIKNILNIGDISFSKRLEDEDSYIKIFSKNEVLKTEVEINQLGSGTINVLNILSVLAYGDYEQFKLNVLMLDEPDSHLHFNHQHRLYKHLEKVSQENNKQIFIITHNSTLISQFDNVLFLEKDKKKIIPIQLEEYLESHLKKIDENHYNVMKELSDAKKEKEKLEELLKENDKPIIFCEGTSDVSILKKAFEKLYGTELYNDTIKIEGGGGEGVVGNKVKNNTSKNVIIGILDNDYAGQQQKKKIISDHSFEVVDDTHCKKGNNNIVILPIPQSRIDSAVYFEKKTFIEYLFSDDTLENKLGIELTQHRGENFKRFDELKIDSIKSTIIKNINNLEREDFNHFIPLFEKIAEVINYTLPTNA